MGATINFKSKRPTTRNKLKGVTMFATLRKRWDFVGWTDLLVMVVLGTLFYLAVRYSIAAHMVSRAVDWAAWLDGFLQNTGTAADG